MEALTNVLEPEFEVVSIVADGRARCSSLPLRARGLMLVVLDISMPLLNREKRLTQVVHQGELAGDQADLS